MNDRIIKRPEILSPVGDVNCLKAAIGAGCDAVYLAGEKYGARAYANNFTKDELIWAIQYAHLFRVKVYLTLNTLLFQEEIYDVVDYVEPLYLAGIDAIIVQDFGVAKIIKDNFPDLELHASTQMAVTGANASVLLKDYGFSRIVPARELSLTEIDNIKKQVDIELEVFVHGSMCYAYSGLCLFSSMLGGRSGNRGRCAGTCRLPMQLNQTKDIYPLSMKDLCGYEFIPQLIEAKVDSFKIEGRMKSPEYVGMVTSIYREGVDAYLKDQEYFVKNQEKVKASVSRLSKLYTRSGVETGYFDKHSSKSMISINSPAYSSSVDYNEETTKSTFVIEEPSISVNAHVCLKLKDNAKLTIYNNEYSVTVETDEVLLAQNRPLINQDIEKQIRKSGGTGVAIKEISFDCDSHIFMGVKQLNELRRLAVDTFIKEYSGLAISENRIGKPSNDQSGQILPGTSDTDLHEKNDALNKNPSFEIKISNLEQLKACISSIESKEGMGHRLYVPFTLFFKANELLKETRTINLRNIYVFFPPIAREFVIKSVEDFMNQCKNRNLFPQGYLVGNLEILQFINQFLQMYAISGELISDYSLYVMNSEAYKFLNAYSVQEFVAPYELNEKKLRNMKSLSGKIIIYGYIPLMETANCVYQTMGLCKDRQHHKIDASGPLALKDRYHKEFQVLCHHDRCENTIYNCVPLALHTEYESVLELGFDQILSFTLEDSEQTKKIMGFFTKLYKGRLNNEDTSLLKEFTKGHYKRGIL